MIVHWGRTAFGPRNTSEGDGLPPGFEGAPVGSGQALRAVRNDGRRGGRGGERQPLIEALSLCSMP